MFALTTRRGRLAVAAMVALMLTMVACIPQDTPEPAVQDTSGEDAGGASAADEDDGDPDGEDADGGSDDTSPEDDGDPVAALTSASAVTCHERNDAGGNSDVVWTLAFDQVDAGTTGTVTYDGPAGTAEVEFEVGADGTATVLLPAMNFGDVFTLTAVTVGGTDLDLAAAGSPLTHTVPDSAGSDCSTHPNA